MGHQEWYSSVSVAGGGSPRVLLRGAGGHQVQVRSGGFVFKGAWTESQSFCLCEGLRATQSLNEGVMEWAPKNCVDITISYSIF